MAFFALEGGMILGVLYLLAQSTALLAPGVPRADLHPTVLGFAAVLGVLMFFVQTSTMGEPANLRRELGVFSVIAFVATSLYCAIAWTVAPSLNRLTTWVAVEAAVAVPSVCALLRWLAARSRVLHPTRENLVIVGTGETAQQVCRWICTHHGDQHSVLGFVDETDQRLGQLLTMGARIQTDFANLTHFGARVDRVIVALDEKRGKLPLRQLMELRLLGVEIEDATSFFERVSGKIAVETMLPSWLIFSEGFKTSASRRLIKRSADIVQSVLLLLVSAPVILLVALLIRLDSRGPVLYRQKRLGMNGVEFDVLKFRSMRHDAERESGPTWATATDPRVTRIGRLIRKLRIDELPQLFNVLRGEMSFVGPRPERAHFVRRLEETIPYYGLRMTARPGITGWAQVEYQYGASDEDALEKLKYDLYYIKNSSLLFDLWIILKTMKVCIAGSGAR